MMGFDTAMSGADWMFLALVCTPLVVAIFLTALFWRRLKGRRC